MSLCSHELNKRMLYLSIKIVNNMMWCDMLWQKHIELHPGMEVVLYRRAVALHTHTYLQAKLICNSIKNMKLASNSINTRFVDVSVFCRSMHASHSHSLWCVHSAYILLYIYRNISRRNSNSQSIFFKWIICTIFGIPSILIHKSFISNKSYMLYVVHKNV